MTQLTVKRDAALKDFLIVVAKLPRSEPQEKLDWLQAWQAGSADAGRRLLESYLPMVVAEAALRRGLGARFETLLAAGNKALAKALRDAVSQPRYLDSIVRHAVMDALKEHWMKAAEKGRIREI